jgi:hypothetical protein
MGYATISMPESESEPLGLSRRFGWNSKPYEAPG